MRSFRENLCSGWESVISINAVLYAFPPDRFGVANVLNEVREGWRDWRTRVEGSCGQVGNEGPGSG